MSESRGQWSPDGAWWWNGQQWLPAAQAPPEAGMPPGAPEPPPPPPGPQPPSGGRQKSRRPRWLIPAIAIIAVLSTGVCIAAVASSNNQALKTTSTPTPTAQAAATPATPATAAKPAGTCTPQPCANDNYGWTVYVSAVVYDYKSSNQFDHPEAGNVFVKFDLSFENKTDKAQSANLFSQFQLLDANGVAHHPGIGTVDCPIWSDVLVAPGGKLGPKCTIFEATAGNAGGLTLLWIPQSFGGGYRIKLS